VWPEPKTFNPTKGSQNAPAWPNRKVFFAYESRTHVEIGKCENGKCQMRWFIVAAGAELCERML